MSTSDLPCATTYMPPNYKVRVIFRGFIIARIAHGSSEAMIGALPPWISSCHQPKIHVYKLFPGDRLDGRIEVHNPTVDLNKDFSVTVFPSPPGAIKKYQKDCDPFNRFDERHNDKQDFRWFGNLSDMHGTLVEVDETQLQPKFLMNSGVFYSSARSDGEATITTPNPTSTKPPRPFGRFALEITAKVYLEPGSSAIFLNGTTPLVPPVSASDNFQYDIIYDCHCNVGDDERLSDFGKVYPYVITNIKEDDQISLEPEPAKAKSPDYSPEVYCTGGTYP